MFQPVGQAARGTRIQLTGGNPIRKGLNFRPVAEARQSRDEIERLVVRNLVVRMLQKTADVASQPLQLRNIHCYLLGAVSGARIAGRPWKTNGCGSASEHSVFVLPLARRVRQVTVTGELIYAVSN